MNAKCICVVAVISALGFLGCARGHQLQEVKDVGQGVSIVCDEEVGIFDGCDADPMEAADGDEPLEVQEPDTADMVEDAGCDA